MNAEDCEPDEPHDCPEEAGATVADDDVDVLEASGARALARRFILDGVLPAQSALLEGRLVHAVVLDRGAVTVHAPADTLEGLTRAVSWMLARLFPAAG